MGIINIDQDLILSQAWVNCDFLAFLGGGVYSKGGVYMRGSVYFQIRDFRGRLFEAGRLFEEIRYGSLAVVMAALSWKALQ